MSKTKNTVPSRHELAKAVRIYARSRKIGWYTAINRLESTDHQILHAVRQYARAKKIGLIAAWGRIENAANEL